MVSNDVWCGSVSCGMAVYYVVWCGGANATLSKALLPRTRARARPRVCVYVCLCVVVVELFNGVSMVLVTLTIFQYS